MRAGMLIGGAGAIAAVPVASLAAMMATGTATTAAALMAIAAVLVSSLALAAAAAHDLDRLAAVLDHAGREGTPPPRAIPPLPGWPLPGSSPPTSSLPGSPQPALSPPAPPLSAPPLPRSQLSPSPLPDPAQPASPPLPPALLPPTRRLGHGIERLARTLATQAAQVGELLRANEAIIEGLPDPLLVLGADRKPKRANAAARAAYGADMAAVLRHPGTRAAIDRAFETGAPQTAELSLPVPVPREVHAMVIVMDQPLADGARAVVVLSDRTRDRAVERMRADFVANASHELRTPLASLMGFIATLQGPAADDPPAQQRFLAIMAEQAGRMNRLIDDLLSLSRVELTEHQPPSDRVDLAALAHRVVAGFEPGLAARRVTLDLQAASDVPAVPADADQIAQVLQNLIDNAVKYGREGGLVQVRLKRAGPGARCPVRPGVVLSVSDDGPGIPKDQVPRLTERFYRVDKGRSRNAGGTGLGLAIVKHIVNRHRGQMVIESEEGHGASFSVWLPMGDKAAGD